MNPDDWKPGDLLACYGEDGLSKAISWGTGSLTQRPFLGPSHVAMIVAHPGLGPVWFESTSLSKQACLFRKASVAGVQVHCPIERVCEYTLNHGAVDIYRLSPLDQLTEEESRLLTELVFHELLPKEARYDPRGALRSGTRLWQLSRLFPNADMQSLFCSEIVAKLLMRLNRLAHDNPSRYNPGRVLRELLRCGIYQWERRHV